MKFFVMANKKKWIVVYKCTPKSFKLVYSSENPKLKGEWISFDARIIYHWISCQSGTFNKRIRAKWFRSMNEIVAKYFEHFL